MYLPLTNKEKIFNRDRCLKKLDEVLNGFKDFEDRNNWTKATIWNEVKNSFAIEGEEMSYQMYTKLINDNQHTQNQFTTFKEVMDKIINEKISINQETLFQCFINSGNAWQLTHEDGFDGFYRAGGVVITGRYDGIESDKGLNDPKKYMDSLIKFINSDYLSDPKGILLKAIIAHIQLAYIHPYYDMNGRMARLLQIWIANNSQYKYLFYFLSQSIQFSKPRYYRAIEKTLHCEKINYNTFIEYILDAIKENREAWEYIKNKVKDYSAMTQSEKEWAIILKMNIKSPDFGWRDIKRELNTLISKQGMLEKLTRFEQLGLLTHTIRKNTKFFSFK